MHISLLLDTSLELKSEPSLSARELAFRLWSRGWSQLLSLNFVALDQEQPCREFMFRSILASESTSIQTLAVQGGGVE